MKKVLFATGNRAKLQRFASGLKDRGIELVSLKDINVDIDVEENGNTAIENALIKARAYAKYTNLPTIAMDDSLYIENIPDDLQPGLYVRRVNGKKLNDEEMIVHYSSLAKKYGDAGRLTARWVYGMALINNDKEATYSWSKEDFFIVDKPCSVINLDYPLNSISINKKLNKYFTDITEQDKLLVQENEEDVIKFIINNIN